MQHYAHCKEMPRWGESADTKARKKHRQLGDQLQQEEYRYTIQKRASHTAPVLFGKDTIKPIEEQSYQHLLLAQEQEARNIKFQNDIYFENKRVRSPSGTSNPLSIWIPPLRMERIKSDGLPAALAGVDLGSLMAVAHVKENMKHQGKKRYGAFTYRSGSTLSSKEAFWASNLCEGRGDGETNIRTNTHPAYLSREIMTPGEKRRVFLERFSNSAESRDRNVRKSVSRDRPEGGNPHTTADPKPEGSTNIPANISMPSNLDIRQVGWAPYREGLGYRTPRNFTDPSYDKDGSAPSARAVKELIARKRERKKTAWNDGFVVNHEKKGYIDTTLIGNENLRENMFKTRESRARGEVSWTRPSDPHIFDAPNFVF